MRIVIALFCIFLASSVTAQSLVKEKITGEWICEKVSFAKGPNLPDTTSQKAKEVIKMTHEVFTNARFIFGADGIFRLKLPASSIKNPMNEEFAYLNGKPWSLNPKALIIDIGGKQNLMSIQVTEKNDVYFFHLDETPIILKMRKLEPAVKGS